MIPETQILEGGFPREKGMGLRFELRSLALMGWIAAPGLLMEAACYARVGGVRPFFLCLLATTLGNLALGAWAHRLGGARGLWIFAGLNAGLSVVLGSYGQVFLDVPSFWSLAIHHHEASAAIRSWELFLPWAMAAALGGVIWLGRALPARLPRPTWLRVTCLSAAWAALELWAASVSPAAVAGEIEGRRWARRMQGSLISSLEDAYETLSLPGEKRAAFRLQKDLAVHRPLPIQILGGGAPPRVLAIQVESLDYRALGRQARDGAFTPYLDRLAAQVGCFKLNPNHTGISGSSGSDFQLLMGLRPLTPEPVYQNPALPWEASLPAALARRGIPTYVLHANERTFWNREEAFQRMGVRRFLDAADIRPEPDARWGRLDESLFRAAGGFIAGPPPAAPALVQIITLTSHGPFDSAPGTRQEPRLSRRYAASLRYVDACLRNFFEGLPRDQRWTVVLYGDHGAGLSTPRYRSFEEDGNESVPGLVFRWEEGRALPLEFSPITERHRSDNRLEIVGLNGLLRRTMLP